MFFDSTIFLYITYAMIALVQWVGLDAFVGDLQHDLAAEDPAPGVDGRAQSRDPLSSGAA